jgi:glutamate---cysteine ligase / carboxylate-amine ligase
VTDGRPLGLFEGFGIEMEFMIVDRESLVVRPIADLLLRDADGGGAWVEDVERGPIAWSNEIVGHLVELKTNGPASQLAGLDAAFHADVSAANELLAKHGAMLLGTAAHPLMDPATETRLWAHGGGEIYAAYDRIFGCSGHGWSNLQSTHLNLPFADDEEFGRLHAAIRLVLPLIPALAASSPFLDGRFTGYLDARLETYRHNQARIPSLTGRSSPSACLPRPTTAACWRASPGTSRRTTPSRCSTRCSSTRAAPSRASTAMPSRSAPSISRNARRRTWP